MRDFPLSMFESRGGIAYISQTMDLLARYDKHPDIDHRTIGGEGFVITPGSSHIHSLNEVGAFILEQIDGKRTLREVVEGVTNEFDIDQERAEKDALAFVLLLEQKGIVAKVGQ